MQDESLAGLYNNTDTWRDIRRSIQVHTTRSQIKRRGVAFSIHNSMLQGEIRCNLFDAPKRKTLTPRAIRAALTENRGVRVIRLE